MVNICEYCGKKIKGSVHWVDAGFEQRLPYHKKCLDELREETKGMGDFF